MNFIFLNRKNIEGISEMAEQISRNIDDIKSGLEKLKVQADDFISQSEYQDDTDNTTFQSVNGETPVSKSQSVAEVAAIDTFAHNSICSWAETTNNLIEFINNDLWNFLEADQAPK